MLRIDGGSAHGFGDYNDAASLATPITLLADTWTTLTNDGLGPNTNLGFLPDGVTQLIDTPGGHIDASQLKFGDVILIRKDYSVIQTNPNSLLEFRYTAGTGLGSYELETIVQRLDAGTSRTYRFSLSIDKFYIGDANTRDNPIIPQIKLSGPGTVVNSGTVVTVLHG